MKRLGFAVAIACAALLLGWRELESPRASSRIATVPAVIAARDIPEGFGSELEVRPAVGKRAYGIRIDDFAALAGMIQPNSRVDIIVVIDDPNSAGKRVAKLFMSNMRVLAIGSLVQRTEDGRPIDATVATIEVSPEEAERLAIASTQGQIQLVLRGYGDADSITTTGATADEVVARLSDVPEQTPAPRSDSARVQIFRGPRR